MIEINSSARRLRRKSTRNGTHPELISDFDQAITAVPTWVVYHPETQ